MEELVLVNNYLLQALIDFTGNDSDRKRKTEEVFTKICRTCLCETMDNNLENKWFLAIGSSIITVTIKDMIEALTEMKIDMDDKLPHHICPTCLQAVDAAYSFRLHSQEIDEVLRALLPTEIDSITGDLTAHLVPTNSEKAEDLQVNPELNNSGNEEIDGVSKSSLLREGDVNNTELNSTTEDFPAQFVPTNSEQKEDTQVNQKYNDSGSREIDDVSESFLPREGDINNTELCSTTGDFTAQLVPTTSEQTEDTHVNQICNDSGSQEVDDVSKSVLPREGDVNNAELDCTTGNFTTQLVPTNSEQTEDTQVIQKCSESQEIDDVSKSFLPMEGDVNNAELDCTTGDFTAQLVPTNSEQTEDTQVIQKCSESQEIDDVSKSFLPMEGDVNNAELDCTTGDFTAQLVPTTSEQTEDTPVNQICNDSGSQEVDDVSKSLLPREGDVNNEELDCTTENFTAQLVPTNSEQTEDTQVIQKCSESQEIDDVSKSFLPMEGDVNNSELGSTTGDFTAQLVPTTSEQTEDTHVNQICNDSGSQEVDDVSKSVLPREGNANNAELDCTTGDFTAQLVSTNSEQTEDTQVIQKCSESQEIDDVSKSFLPMEGDVNNTELGSTTGDFTAQLVPTNSEQTEDTQVIQKCSESVSQEINNVSKSCLPREGDVNITELDCTTGDFEDQLVPTNSEQTDQTFNDSGCQEIDDVLRSLFPREGSVINAEKYGIAGEFTDQLVPTNSEQTDQTFNDSGCQEIDDVLRSLFPREGSVINAEKYSIAEEFTDQLVPTNSEQTDQTFNDSGCQEIDDVLRSLFPREGSVINAEKYSIAGEFTARLVPNNFEQTEGLHANQTFNDNGCQDIDDVLRSFLPREDDVINTEIDSATGELTAQLVPTNSEQTEGLHVNQNFNDNGCQDIDDVLRSFLPREDDVSNTEIDSATGELTAQLVPTNSEQTEGLHANQTFNDNGCQEIDDVLRSFLPKERDVITIGDLTPKLVPTESERTEVLQISQQINDCQVSFVIDCATAPTSDEPNQCNITNTNHIEHVAERFSIPGKRTLFKCRICSKEYHFRNGLYNHMVVAHIEKKEIKCTRCQRKFKNAENLEGHKKRFCVPPGTVKNKLKQGPAKITLYRKKDKANIDEEVTIEINNLSCSLCDEIFELEAEFLNHLPDHKIKTCPHCKKTFPRVAYLESHIWSHGSERPFLCPLCSKGFTATRGLRVHIIAHTDRESYTCSECAKAFFSERDYINHQKMHQENQTYLDLPQPYPKDPFLCAKKLLIHSDDCDEYICDEEANLNPVKATDFATTSEWVSDYLENIDVPPSALDNLLAEPSYQDTIWQPPAPYNITIQQEITADGQASFKVINEPNIENEAAPPDRTEDDTNEIFGAEAFGKFTCALANCKMEFKRHTEIIHHYTSKHCSGPSPIKCPICSMVFPGKLEMYNHLKSHLKCEYKCPYCPKTYSESCDLKQHLHTHSGERPFKCPKCPKMFKRRPDAKVHLRTHRICKEYKCNVCCKEYFSTTGLLMHMKGHAIIKELQCHYCNKQFPTRNRMLNHKRNVCEKKIKV